MADNPDVVVVGGGVIGLSCAWRLAQGGRRVVVLERATCGAGATLASLGALWPPSPLIDQPPQNFHRKSLAMFEAFVAELAAASGLPVAFRRLGHIDLLITERQVANAARQCAAAPGVWPDSPDGPPMEILSEAQLRWLEPQVTCPCRGALWCRVSAQVRVEQLMAALAAACARAGAQIMEGAAVEKILINAGRACGVMANGKVYAAERILLAAGAWTGGVDRAATGDLGIRPVRGQGVLLRHSPALAGRIIKNGPVYFVPWDQGRVLLGSTTEPEAGWNCFPTAHGMAQLLRLATATIGAVARAKVEMVWAGLRPDAPRHQPIIGAAPGVHGLFVAAGHYKTGIGMAPATAQLVVEQMIE